jgi:hypothetical protein
MVPKVAQAQRRVQVLFPTVHLNGRSRNQLVGHCNDAYNALDKALRILIEAAPNARDYPQGSNAFVFKAAVAEHTARVQKIREVMPELMAIVERLSGPA